jgi:Mrp family chromosome partitioning ATPase
MNRIMQLFDGRSSAVTTECLPGDTLQLKFPSIPPAGRLEPYGGRASLAALDAFRTFALTIERLAQESPIRTVSVLSAVSGEGRSLSAELLALTLSELRPPVRLLDADPYQPASDPRRRNFRFVVGQRRGDTSPLGSIRGGISPGEEPSGNGSSPFSRIPLAREVFPSHSAFLRDVRAALDTETAMGASVLVDLPACSVSSIGFAVAQMTDAAIYVVRPGLAPLETHRDVVAQAAMLDVRILGILLNEG